MTVGVVCTIALYCIVWHWCDAVCQRSVWARG